MLREMLMSSRRSTATLSNLAIVIATSIAQFGCLAVAFGDDQAVARKITFESDVQPLLTRFGCNAGACHGKSRGQNGFALSLLGFDSDFDYAALVSEARGRRVFAAAPEDSLVLRKATGQLPHGGGKRIDVDSQYYEDIKLWIRSGAPRTAPDAPKLVQVVAQPASQSLQTKETFPLRVIAEYSDGHRRDVTDASAFQSNDRTTASISTAGNGIVQAGSVPGEAAIMARYMNHIAVCAVTIPLPGSVPESTYENLPRQNPVDDLVWKKLKVLGMLRRRQRVTQRFSAVRISAPSADCRTPKKLEDFYRTRIQASV